MPALRTEAVSPQWSAAEWGLIADGLI